MEVGRCWGGMLMMLMLMIYDAFSTGDPYAQRDDSLCLLVCNFHKRGDNQQSSRRRPAEIITNV